MRFIIVICITLFVFESQAQKLNNCSKCSTQKYTESAIRDNKRYELSLLRNEIFARHNYTFKNQRLEEYFYDFEWYSPNKENSISLNAIEKSNVALFKKHEDDILEERKLIIKELKKLKTALNENDKTYLNVLFKDLDKNIYNTITSTVNNVLNTVNLDHINWFKGNAKYQIEIDDGYTKSSKSIYISKNKIYIGVASPYEHSSLMKKNNEAFEFPSTYFSESENSIGANFIFKNGKIQFESPHLAG